MLGKRGTAWTPGQFAEVCAAIVRALAEAIKGTDPKVVIKLFQNGEELARVLRQRVINGDLPTPVSGGTASDNLPRPADENKSSQSGRGTSQIQLLTQLKAAGVKIWIDDPNAASYGPLATKKVEFATTPIDLGPIFAAKDKGEKPWNLSRLDQESWGGGTIASVCRVLWIILEYVRVHGHVPDPDRVWWIRCSEKRGAGFSLFVLWDPDYGLSVYCVLGDEAYPYVGALPGS